MKGHGNRWRMNFSMSGNVAMPVRFHSKSVGRYVQGDRPKRDASHPLIHRMVAVATKTAEKTSASAAMVVQKTPKQPIVENHNQSTTKSPVSPSTIKQIERTMAAMMSTITSPRHGASRQGPVIPIVMAEMIAEAGTALGSIRVALPRPLAQCSRLMDELLTQFS